MTDRISKVAELVILLQNNPRITVRRIQEEIGLSRRTTYRYINAVTKQLSMRIENGVIVRNDEREAKKTCQNDAKNHTF